MSAPFPTWRSPLDGAALTADGPHSLAGTGQRWPVVDGIAYLRTRRAGLVRAVLEALDGGHADAGLALLLADQDDWARTPPPDAADLRQLVADHGRLAFRAAMAGLALGGVATYFTYRWSDPTFLAGLALTEAHRGTAASVIEVACGAGHHLRELARVGLAATGGDVVFAKLWLARHWIVPTATLVCFDAAAPWPFQDAAAELLTCHDALYFLPEKPHVAHELRRVAGPAGRILVGHTHNALVDNLSAGAPLDPAGYAALFGSPLLYDDRELTRALIGARTPVPQAAEVLAAAPAIALAVTAGAPMAVLDGVAVPDPGTPLRAHPLLGRDRVRWPSERYEAEYGALSTWTDAEGVPATAIMGESANVNALARRRALLDLPARW